jgi:hypothetical protein
VDGYSKEMNQGVISWINTFFKIVSYDDYKKEGKYKSINEGKGHHQQ